jgi:hypothetical protein
VQADARADASARLRGPAKAGARRLEPWTGSLGRTGEGRGGFEIHCCGIESSGVDRGTNLSYLGKRSCPGTQSGPGVCGVAAAQIGCFETVRLLRGNSLGTDLIYELLAILKPLSYFKFVETSMQEYVKQNLVYYFFDGVVHDFLYDFFHRDLLNNNLDDCEKIESGDCAYSPSCNKIQPSPSESVYPL